MVIKADEGQVTMCPAGLLAASKNAKLNHQLSFSEFMYAKNLFLTAIDNVKWGNDTPTPSIGFSTIWTTIPCERKVTTESVCM